MFSFGKTRSSETDQRPCLAKKWVEKRRTVVWLFRLVTDNNIAVAVFSIVCSSANELYIFELLS